MPPEEPDQFVCEELTPAPGSFDTDAMSRGEPGLPERFTWRDVEYRVVKVARKWKTTGPCESGRAERYVRRHWYRITTDPPTQMTIYFDRQACDRGRPKTRWWIYSVSA